MNLIPIAAKRAIVKVAVKGVSEIMADQGKKLLVVVLNKECMIVGIDGEELLRIEKEKVSKIYKYDVIYFKMENNSMIEYSLGSEQGKKRFDYDTDNIINFLIELLKKLIVSGNFNLNITEQEKQFILNI